MSEQLVKDEFERRLHFTSFISTLADVAAKMNPNTLISAEAKRSLEEAGLKDQFQAAQKKWLDMLMVFMDKAAKLGASYPIEAILGIREAQGAGKTDT